MGTAGQGQEVFGRAVFDAAGQALAAQAAGQGDAACGEPGRAGQGIDGWEFDDYIGTAFDGPDCAVPLIEEGRFAALDEGAAHDDDDGCIGTGCLADLRYQMGVTGMERVEFGDDGDRFHRASCMFKNSQNNRSV